MERWWIFLGFIFFAASSHAEVTRGEMLCAPCFACHGPDGVANGDIPSLDETEKIRVKMIDFREEDSRTTIMTRIARGYTDNEIDMIAEYIGGKHSKGKGIER